MSAAASDIHVVQPEDHVGIALRDLSAGETAGGVTIRADIARGHKLALRDIAAGADVLKYGWPIGRASRAITAGDHVHTHNLATKLSALDQYAYSPPAAHP